MSAVDLVIFGATGFTGKHAVVEAVRLSKKYPGLTWAVAGRSEKKLDEVLQEASKKTGEDLSSIRVIIADVTDESSLHNMCKQARVVVNCCGPYNQYGEPVVRAAIDNKTHHVDVSGETLFMESMQLHYNERAREAGVYIVSACGFDSVPNDMGLVHLQNNFKGTLNSVESYLSVSIAPEFEPEARRTGAINYGTWESLVNMLAQMGELAALRKKLYPNSLPSYKPKLERRSVLHKRGDRWYLPFLGSDASVVYRTQRFLHDNNNQRPSQFKAYVSVGNLFQSLLMLLACSVLFVMSKSSFTRSLLLKYPRLFSGGMVSREGPSEGVTENTKFKFELYGEGWEEGADVDATAPNKNMTVQVRGSNPGYGATVSALLLCALTILQQQNKMPSTGGVMTTGAAFKDTDLVKKLTENNLVFEIIDPK